MADNTVSHAQDAPNSEEFSTRATVTHAQGAPPAESFNSSAEHVFALTGGANLSNPLNTLEDAGWEENPETKAWFDGTNDELTVGWSYSTDDPRSGLMSGKADSTSNDLYLYNRTLIPAHQGDDIYFQAWIKVSAVGASTGAIHMGLEWMDEAQVVFDSHEASIAATGVSDTDYQKLYPAPSIAPAGTAYARFYLRITGITANEWYVDDCFCGYALPGELLDINSDIAIRNISGQNLLLAFNAEILGELSVGDSLTVNGGDSTIHLAGATSGSVRLVAPDTVATYEFPFPDAAAVTPSTEFLRGDGEWAVPAGAGYTNEEAQDAVGAILADSATVDFTYTDATPEITASVKDDSITYTKMQNVSATDKLLGRSTAGAGDVEEIPCTAAGRALLDDANAAAQRTTLELDTASTPQFARVGVGAAAGAGGTFVTVNNALDTITTEIGITASAATGNVAGAVYRATADVAQMQFGVWASSRTTSRFGVAVGGYVEAIAIAGNGMIYGTFHNAPVIIGVNALARMRFETTGNVKLAGTATRATTEGTNHLDIFNGTAPVGTLANGISLYSTAGELRVLDAAGNPTLLSPHDENNNWIFDSHVGKGEDKKRIVVDMEKMVRFLNEHFGADWVHEYAVAGGQAISQPSRLQVGALRRFLNSLKGWVLCCISKTKL